METKKKHSLTSSTTARASFWTIISFVLSQLLRFFSNLILTRLLLPELFGLMAIVTVVRVGVYMCSEIGLKVNIIRHENGESPDILNTAWTIQVIRGVILWGLISFIGWLLFFLTDKGVISADSIYSDSRLPSLLAVTGVVAFITGFESTRIWLAQRNMMLGRLSLLDLFSQFVGLVAMILWAWVYKDVWALVVGTIVSAFLKTVLSHFVLVGGNNYFYWNKKIVNEFLHFGKWLSISAMVTFVGLNGDRMILGGVISAEQLGYYTVAYFLATSMKDLIESLTFNVWYPLLSKVNREDREKVVNIYYDIRQKLDIMIFFVVGLLYVTAPLIIEILYDDRYQSSGWMLRVLAITIIGSGFRLGSTLLLSMGNPKIGTIAIILRTVALLCMIPSGYNYYGIQGAIWAIAINPLFEMPIILWFFSKYKIISWHKEIRYIPMLAVGYFSGVLFLDIYSYIKEMFGYIY